MAGAAAAGVTAGSGVRAGAPARGAGTAGSAVAGPTAGAGSVPTSGGPTDLAPGARGDARPRATTGIPVASSAAPADAGRRGGGGGGRSGADRPRRRRWPWVVAALVVLALVVGASGVVAYTTLPSATVTIRPVAEELGPIDLVVHADPAVTDVDVATATIPAQSVEVPVEVSDTFEATGKKKEETKATGSVTFVSKDPTKTNSIPAGSVVRTAAGVGFSTRSAITIPKAKIEGLTIIPGTATVKVVAVKGGPEANVAPNTISVVPSSEDPVLLEVRNRAATTGGTRKTTTIVTQKDVDAAVKTLDKRLKARFADASADPARAPEGTILVADTARLGPSTAEPAPETLVDQEVETFDLLLSATGSVTAYAPSAARSVALARLVADVPEGFVLVEGTASAEAGEATAVDTAADVPTTSSAQMVRAVDEAVIRALVAGRSVAEAEAALTQYGDVTVEVWPSFMPGITSSAARIEIRIQPVTAGGANGGGSPASSPGATPGAPSPTSP